jgi:beta-glucanase (GH16 family)
MPRYRTLLVVLVALLLMPAGLASARSAPHASRSSSDLRYVSAAGQYTVSVTVASAAGSQYVAVAALGKARRSIYISRRRPAQLEFHAALRPGPVRVKVSGSRFRPQLQVRVAPGKPAHQSATQGTAASGQPTPSRSTTSVSGPSAITSQPPTTSTTPTSDQRLVWSDEFGGAAGSQPSSTKWTANVGDYGAGDGEQERYTNSPSNAQLNGHGDLQITARSATTPDAAGRGYTSAELQTQGLFSAKYGLVEARMQLPAGTGLWPAFWMLGDNIDTVGWPSCGEIDIMEALDGDPLTVHGTIHGPDGSSDGYAIGNQTTATSSLTAGFHTYGMQWTPDSISFLLDGRAYATVTRAELSGGDRWMFDQPFHMLLNLAVGGWAGSPTTATRFPATLLVDWVRVYQ